MRGFVTTTASRGRRAEASSFRNLGDAAARYGVAELAPGRIQLWLVQARTRWTKELASPEKCLTWRPKNLYQSHKLVGAVRGGRNLPGLFKLLEDTSRWAPNGEHRALLTSWDVAKSHIGTGDLLIDSKGNALMANRWAGKFSGPVWHPSTILSDSTEFAQTCCPGKKR